MKALIPFPVINIHVNLYQLCSGRMKINIKTSQNCIKSKTKFPPEQALQNGEFYLPLIIGVKLE